MPSLAVVSVYNVVLVIPILAVVVAFGQALTYPLLLAAARRGGPGATATIHHVQGTVGAILVVVLGLSSAYLAPRDRRLARLAQDDPRAEYDAVLRQVGLVGLVSALPVLVAVFLMVTKPGA